MHVSYRYKVLHVAVQGQTQTWRHSTRDKWLEVREDEEEFKSDWGGWWHGLAHSLAVIRKPCYDLEGASHLSYLALTPTSLWGSWGGMSSWPPELKAARLIRGIPDLANQRSLMSQTCRICNWNVWSIEKVPCCAVFAIPARNVPQQNWAKIEISGWK